MVIYSAITPILSFPNDPQFMIHFSSLVRRFTCGAMLLLFLFAGGCQRRDRDRSEAYVRQLDDQKTKADNLRKGMRYLRQMTPANAKNVAREVQLELNTWIKTIDPSRAEYMTSELLRELPAEELKVVGSANPLELQFDNWDIDYLYECQMARELASWIVDSPIRDSLLAPIVAGKQKSLSPESALQLEEAYKLFDWTIRNIALENEGSSDVASTTTDPRLPLADSGVGYGYLPWEAMLYSRGDFVERGRVFTALARQRNLETFWISVGTSSGEPGKLFAIGVLIDAEVLLFEPKLGMPILEPDGVEFATLQQARENPRVLRRLDLAGQFDYALEADSLQSVQFLLDATPTGASARMKLLEQALLGDERMKVFVNLDVTRQRLLAIAPAGTTIHLWQTPLLAQLQAASIRARLRETTSFTQQYITQHGVWMMPTPASIGRLKHLAGKFENTLEERGALATYMESRIDDESIRRLAYDPQVQKELQVVRDPNESLEQFQMRVAQAQFVFGRAKLDASFVMGQLHFDRGNYDAAEKWLRDRVIDDPRADTLHAASWYTLARAYQEQGKLAEADNALTHQPSPQEAGNRLRLRYLRR